MVESSDWDDGSDILNSDNFHLTDEQLEYKKKYPSKDNKLFKDLDQIKSLMLILILKVYWKGFIMILLVFKQMITIIIFLISL